MESERRKMVKLVVLFACALWTASCHNHAMSQPPAGWGQLPEILGRIEAPTFPDREFDVTDFGAEGDGRAKCTEAFEKAVRACHLAGGGRVVVGEGVFLTGPIHLRSNVCLQVGKGATILFSDRFEDYLPAVLVRWEGRECYNLSPLIYANGCRNIAVTGGGTLDGQGKTWWSWRKGPGAPYRKSNEQNAQWAQENVPVEKRVQGKKDFHWCPTFISPVKCQNVLIEGLTIVDGPFWNVHPLYCKNVTVRNLTIKNHGPNGDGCNPDSCRDVLVEDCYFDTGDDCIAIKSGRNADGRRVNIPSENIVVRRCAMKDGHGGVVMGSEMSGGVRNVFVEDCTMDSPNLDRALRIKTNSVRGGFVENVYMRNVSVGQVGDAVLRINFHYGEKDTGQFAPRVRNINMENVTSKKSNYGLRIEAYERAPAADILIKNCSFQNVAKPNVLEGVENVRFNNVRINDELFNETVNPGPSR